MGASISAIAFIVNEVLAFSVFCIYAEINRISGWSLATGIACCGERVFLTKV